MRRVVGLVLYIAARISRRVETEWWSLLAGDGAE
jgi:hypothetical protein